MSDILNDLASHFASPFDHTQDARSLSFSRLALQWFMFVHFDCAGKRLEKRLVRDGVLDALEHEPCRLLRDVEAISKLYGRYSGLGRRKLVDGREPQLERHLGIFKDCPIAYRERPAALPTFVVLPRRASIHLGMLASRANG